MQFAGCCTNVIHQMTHLSIYSASSSFSAFLISQSFIFLGILLTVESWAYKIFNFDFSPKMLVGFSKEQGLKKWTSGSPARCNGPNMWNFFCIGVKMYDFWLWITLYFVFCVLISEEFLWREMSLVFFLLEFLHLELEGEKWKVKWMRMKVESGMVKCEWTDHKIYACEL